MQDSDAPQAGGLAGGAAGTPILHGIKQGFRIGFDSSRVGLAACGRNMLSASEHPDVVERCLGDELQTNRIVRIPSQEQAQYLDVQCSRDPETHTGPTNG